MLCARSLIRPRRRENGEDTSGTSLAVGDAICSREKVEYDYGEKQREGGKKIKRRDKDLSGEKRKKERNGATG